MEGTLPDYAIRWYTEWNLMLLPYVATALTTLWRALQYEDIWVISACYFCTSFCCEFKLVRLHMMHNILTNHPLLLYVWLTATVLLWTSFLDRTPNLFDHCQRWIPENKNVTNRGYREVFYVKKDSKWVKNLGEFNFSSITIFSACFFSQVTSRRVTDWFHK